MKTKNQLTNRILSLVLVFVLVLGMVPTVAFAAEPVEAQEYPNIPNNSTPFPYGSYFYFTANNCLYSIYMYNLKADSGITHIKLYTMSGGMVFIAQQNGEWDDGKYRSINANNDSMTPYPLSNLPKSAGESVELHYNSNYEENILGPSFTVTCLAVGSPEWAWNGTTATARFLSEDGNAAVTRTVNGQLTSTTPAENCLQNVVRNYSATVTLNGKSYVGYKQVSGEAGPHSYTYSASGDTLTETCTNNCGYSAEATLQLKSDADLTYTGSAIEPMEMVYPEGWAGEEKQPAAADYKDNVNAGTNTASCSFTYIGSATVSNTFTIKPANLDDCQVTMTPASGTYTGSYHNRPNYTLTYNGKQLVKDIDYIVDANWSGDFTNVGSCNLILKGNGNFTGYKSLTYTIHKATPTANLFEMTLPQNPVYDGITKFPVTVAPKTPDLGEITAVKYNGSTEAPVNAGTYKVTVDVAESENYNAIYDLELGNFTVAPAAGSIIIPANQSVVYDGAAVEQSDLTPAITTDGALTVKWYDSEGTEITAPTDVGTYQIGISAAAGSNYNAVEEVKQTFTITKADPICTAPTAIAGLVYNGREQTLVIPVESMGGTVYYSLDGVTYTDYVPKGINAQEYTVYYKVVGDANHNDMEPKTVTAKIAPWNIETASCKAGVWGGPFTYNGQEHTPTPQIDAWVDDYPVPESPYAPGADVRLTEGTDYTVSYSNNVNAGEAVVTFTGKGNYTGTITRKFTIDPKPITVTIADKTSVYGEAVAELTATDDGIVNNDTNVYSLTTAATSTANAGEYAITGTALDSNYAITFVGGTYTITKVPVNSIGTDKTVDYTAGMEVDLSQMFSIDENAGAVDYWITDLTGEGSFTTAPYLYRIDKAGKFTVKITTKETANYKSGEATAVLTVNPGDPAIGEVTAGVVNDTLETSAIVLTRENTDVNGNLTVDAGQTLAWGDNIIRYTFTPEDTANYKVVKGEVAVTVVDTIAPVGTVSIDDNKWSDLWNTITFGLFFKETQTVSVTASDDLSGVAKIEYIESKTALDLDAVKAATQWTEMENGIVSVTLEDTKQFIYYIRITDKAGNVAFLSTDGAEYDTTAPVITGVDNGVTYYTTQKVTVTDKNIDTITLNGEAATDAITLEGNKEATYTIVATDKAGNSTTVTVTMKPIKELAKATENLGNDNVTSADAPALEELVAKLDELIADPDTSGDGERETLEQHKVIAEALLKTIEDVAKATDTENTAKVEDVTADNVTPEDKSNLEDAKADLEDALENNGGNYTEEEKKAIKDEIQRIEDALEIVENVEAAEDAISDLPATVEPDDEETVAKIEEAKKIYGGLTDYEKSLVDEMVKEKLDKLTAAAIAYDIVKGDGGKWSEGTASGLSFTVNGPISKFVSVEIDGKVIDAKYYSVKAGSTIITLNASYLETLSVGTHTITVVYSDGETEGTFKINPKSATPATGDNFNILLWTSVMIISLAAIAVLLIEQKKRRYVK